MKVLNNSEVQSASGGYFQPGQTNQLAVMAVQAITPIVYTWVAGSSPQGFVAAQLNIFAYAVGCALFNAYYSENKP